MAHLYNITSGGRRRGQRCRLARDRDCVTFFFAGRERTSSGNSFLYKKHKCTNTYIRRESIYVRVRKQEKTNVMLRNAANFDSFDTHTYVHG